MKSENLSALRGHAGEMYVSAELMRRGWLAAMTARGSRSFDILARRSDRPVFCAIRVKTGRSPSFLWSAKKDGTLFLDMVDVADFTVIVDLPEKGGPVYYVVPTKVLDCQLRKSHAAWLAQPGARGQQRSTTDKTRCLWMDDKVDRIGHGYSVKFSEYREAWHLLSEPS
jgi:hypothetical protein